MDMNNLSMIPGVVTLLEQLEWLDEGSRIDELLCAPSTKLERIYRPNRERPAKQPQMNPDLARKIQKMRRNPMFLPSFETMSESDAVENYGMSIESLNLVWDLCQPEITSEMERLGVDGIGGLGPFHSFLLTLQFLRRYEEYYALGKAYSVTRNTVQRIIQIVIPALRSCVHFDWTASDFPDLGPKDQILGEFIWGAIDCSFHKRRRTHPHQAEYYRTDKLSHGLSLQLLCDTKGRILNFQTFLGHNNDMGCLMQAKVPLDDANGNELRLLEWLETLQDAIFLADGGYRYDNVEGLLTATQIPAALDGVDRVEWFDRLGAKRAVVEQVFGRVKNWHSASDVFRHTPIFQATCLTIVYWLVSIDIEARPLINTVKGL